MLSQKEYQNIITGGNTPAYGTYPPIDSSSSVKSQLKYTPLSEINNMELGTESQPIWLRAHLFHVRSVSKKMCFLTFRQKYLDIQGVAAKFTGANKEMIEFLSHLHPESLLDVYGTLVSTREPVTGCSIQNMEIQLHQVYVVTSAPESLPIQVIKGTHTLLSTRLLYPELDLRTKARQAIFQFQNILENSFRSYLTRHDFTQVHTPKITSLCSEGGCEVFSLKYFNDKENAYLAQSPQLYKEMLVNSGFERVYEVGHIFRAENTVSHRHLTEYVGVDIEMAIHHHYQEVIDFLLDLFKFVMNETQEKGEHLLPIIQEIYPEAKIATFTPLVLSYPEGVKMLRDAGYEMEEDDDLNLEKEKKLGDLVAEKYNSQFYILTDYPTKKRPFYVMPSPKNPKFSNTFDIMLNGEEISSGGQRQHQLDEMIKQMKDKEIDSKGIQAMQSYLNSLQYGSFPHGGCGIGLERMTMLMLNIPNIRITSFYPHDPSHFTP